ncbi:MAG: hypothetical protein AAGM67_09950, partial [Bacteroidota bacterium]
MKKLFTHSPLFATSLGLMVALLLSPALHAQSYKAINTPFHYQQPPLAPLEGQFKTFSVKVDEMELKATDYGVQLDELIPKLFDLTSYERVAENGDFEVIIELGQVAYIGKEIDKYKLNEKNKAGETVERTYYSFDVSYHLPFKVGIYDGKRKLMRENVFNKRGETRYTRYGKSTRVTALTSNFLTEKDKFLYDTYQREIKRLMRETADWLKSEIDQRYVKVKYLELLQIKKADKYGAEKINSAVDAMIAMEEAGKTKRSPKEIQQDLQPHIDALQASLKQFSATDKKESKIHFAAALALAKIYTFLQQPAEGRKYFQMAEATMSGLRPESFVKTFIPLIKEMERRVAANQAVKNTYTGTFDAMAAQAFATNYESTRQAEIENFTDKGTVAEQIDPNAYLITT